ncbi:MAG: GntR family transcriptional regulator [Planctomycetes bacterium]|jgi:GntR family transcriptional regulator|nr:GntR family transcriptional regulator [Planctomycetota bacterium]
MNEIDRDGRLPLYRQVYEILHKKILLKEWKPGDRLPTESELMRDYGVSRITVRTVLDMLVQEGLIYRQAGRGTFVAHATLEQGLSQIISFTEDMQRRGFTVSTRVLFSGVVPATAHIAERLRIEPGEELAHLERLRLADGEPMCIEHSYFVHRHCPGILEHDFSTRSLREVKIRQYGIRWTHAKQTIQAINAPEEVAHLLGISRGGALLFFERVSFSQDSIPMEFLQAYYRADRYVLYNELQGGTG